MNITITNNASQTAQQIGQMATQFQAAVEKALDAEAGVILRAKQRQIDKTYRRRIPLRRKSRQPKWKRSGDFQRDQTIVSEPNSRKIGPVGNSEKYEARLANLPTGPDGINRSNPAGAEAHRITEPQVGPVFQQTLRNELGI